MTHDYIKRVSARQVYTIRHIMGIEATVETECGIKAKAVCNAGISVGSHEVSFLYDNDEKWNGRGVTKAAESANTIINDVLRGMDVTRQSDIDYTMLKLKNVASNAVAAVSAAVLKAGALSLDVPLYQHIGGVNAVYLPVPSAPAFQGDDRWGGGVTTPGTKPTVSFVCADFGSFAEASYAGWEVYQYWREEMARRGQHETLYNMFLVREDAFKNSDEEIYEVMESCIHRAGYDGRIGIQIDCAADTYYDREKKVYRGLFDRTERDRDQLLAYYLHLIKEHPFYSIEDPFHENDYEGHALLTKACDIQIVGDDLFTTMESRVEEGYRKEACNTVLFKVNQVGTITQALEMVRHAYYCGYGVMPCESRGEGEAIADYCVGINAGCLRENAIGIFAANRFLAIEQELGPVARFWGWRGLKGERFKALAEK